MKRKHASENMSIKELRWFERDIQTFQARVHIANSSEQCGEVHREPALLRDFQVLHFVQLGEDSFK